MRLEKKKVTKMMKAYGLSEKEAKKRWYAERKGTRMPHEQKNYSGGKLNTHKKKEVA
jgi:hypothetical protein